MSYSGIKFGTFVGRFPSDGAANMAVKGLKYERKKSVTNPSLINLMVSVDAKHHVYSVTNKQFVFLFDGDLRCL